METFAAMATSIFLALAVVAVVYQFVSKPGGSTVSKQVTGAATSIVGDMFKG